MLLTMDCLVIPEVDVVVVVDDDDDDDALMLLNQDQDLLADLSIAICSSFFSKVEALLKK